MLQKTVNNVRLHHEMSPVDSITMQDNNMKLLNMTCLLLSSLMSWISQSHHRTKTKRHLALDLNRHGNYLYLQYGKLLAQSS